MVDEIQSCNSCVELVDLMNMHTKDIATYNTSLAVWLANASWFERLFGIGRPAKPLIIKYHGFIMSAFANRALTFQETEPMNVQAFLVGLGFA